MSTEHILGGSFVPSASALSIVHSDDSSPADDEKVHTLESVIQEMIDATPEAQGLTVEDVLHDEDFKDILSLAEKAWQDRLHVQQKAIRAKEAAAEMERQRIKKEKLLHLRVTAVQAAGFNPLSSEHVDQVNRYLAKDAVPNQPKRADQNLDRSKSEVPRDVLELQKQWKGKGWPEFVFQINPEVRDGRAAQAFRSWCVNYAMREIDDMFKKKDLPDQSRQLLEEQKRRLSVFSYDSTLLIKAWGLDHKNRATFSNREEDRWVSQQLQRNYKEIFALSLMPKLETPEEKAAREEAEAKQQKMEVRKRDLYTKLVDRLVSTNPGGLDSGFADRFAAKKSKMEKYLGVELTDELITSIFVEAAINRLEVAEKSKTDTEKEQGRNTAMFYANAAGMSEEDLDTGLAELLQKQGDKSAKDSAEAGKEKDKIGKPTPPPAPPVEEGNGGGKPGRRRGGKPKKDGNDKKPTGGKRDKKK